MLPKQAKMIAIDTNILVRYAVKDDRRQTVKATDFLKNNQCRILKTVLLELVWVLSSTSGYGLDRRITAERIRHVCGLPTVSVEDPTGVAQALVLYEQGMDFGDALHLTSSNLLTGFATFDRRLAQKAVQLIPEQPVTLL